MKFIDTHIHLDGEEFAPDIDQVVERAREAGVQRMFLPAIDVKSCHSVLATCQRFPDLCFPMLGLHPEEVRSDWRSSLEQIKEIILSSLLSFPSSARLPVAFPLSSKVIAIGEVGLDYYWSREFEQEQLEAFEEQVRWSVEMRLPLMIHCRKAQNELVAILRRYKDDLPGGVFHCFTGNDVEARQLLEFPNFVLGIGGVLTFKKSHLPEVLPVNVPLNRIVLETDAPYMAPVPMRGQRNESAFITYIIEKLADSYGVSAEVICEQTNENVSRIFSLHKS